MIIKDNDSTMISNNSPKVSICVPVYKAEKYIKKCIESLLRQTYDNLEFLFINDGTPDKSMDILQDVLDHYPQNKHQIIIKNLPQNKGNAYVRNLAINSSTGDFIFFVDSDDWVENNAIEILIAKQLETNAEIISGNHCTHYEDGREIIDKINLICADDPIGYIIKKSRNYHLWGRLIRRSLFIDNHIYCKDNLNVADDLQIYPKLCYFANKHVCIDKVIYHYNKCNVQSIGRRKKNLNWFEQLLESYNIFYDFVDQFEEKKYTSLLHQGKVDFLYKFMIFAIKEECKDGFELLKSELINQETHYPQCRYHDIKHLVKKHYLISKMIMKCKSK